MDKLQLSFWLEHNGFCIWSKNDIAKEKYGYAIKNHALPISTALINELEALENEYASYLDWDCPQNPSLWTNEHKENFFNRATATYNRLVNELGSEFEIVNEVGRCIK